MKALVLLSGGQDSTTCLLWAIKQYGVGNVAAIGFNYGQKHVDELQCAQIIAERLLTPYVIKDCRGLTAPSALTNHSEDVNAAHSRNSNLPATFTAGRNILFLSIAAAFAYQNGCEKIVTGVCETDYSGYPDCRQAFIKNMERTLSFGLDCRMAIQTPLMFLTKAETWKLAKQLSPEVSRLIAKQDGYSHLPDTMLHDAGFTYDPNYAFELVRMQTLTDYNGSDTLNEWGRGVEDNPASKLRAAGYWEAKAHGWV